MRRQPVFFGWRVVSAAFTIAVFAWGIGFYGPSVFLRALHVERGWSMAWVSAAISAHFVVSAGLVAYLSDVHRRFGIVVVTRAGIITLAAGMLAWALAEQLWQLFGAALLSGAGWAATSGAAINAMVAPWFDRGRAAALAMAFNGASVGGIVFMPLWVGLIARLGMSGAASILGAVMIVALWSLIGRCLGPTPESLGLAPDSGGPPHGEPGNAAHAVAPIARASLVRDQRFVTMSAAFALGLFAQVGLFTHLLALLSPRFGDAGAAAALSLSIFAAVAGQTLLGWLLGARDRRHAAAVNFLVQACGVGLLAVPAAPAAVPIAGCILLGLGIGNLVSLPPLIAQAEFERQDVPRVVACAVAINQLVFAFAPGIFGALHDVTRGFLGPLLFTASMQVSSAMLVLAGRRRHAGTEGGASGAW